MALLAGCGSSDQAAADGSSASAASTTLTVYAAASLTAPYTELGSRYEAAHPGTTVRFTFAGSSDLVTQLTQGAPGDVLATADTTTMGRAVDAGVTTGSPQVVATNTLEIATTPGNPRGITSLADLAEDGTSVVVCAPQVPCGAATTTVERSSGVTLRPVSEESSVTDVLTKVTSGQADAGLVYRTDVAGAAGKVTGVEFPESASAVNRYPVVALSGSASPAAAADLVAFLAGPDARGVLAAAGFGAP
ncbi:molybdate ABC transporter substrate-binding protein [Rhodococcus aerolatus]